MHKWVLFILGLLTLAGAQASSAQTPEEFYRGKQVRFIVGTAAGQEYDLWARMIARHLRHHIPGTPTIIVENMPGAGHVIAANYLFDIAARDGTVIGMVSRNIPDAAVLKLPGVRFDPRKFNWLGSPELAHRVLIVSANSGFTRAEELFERELIIGAVGAAQAVTTAPILLKNILGMKLKVVTGYHAPQDVLLAMERGEVGGVVETIATMKGKRAQHVLSGKVRLLFNMEQKRVPEFNAPSIFEFIQKDEDRQIFQFLAVEYGDGQAYVGASRCSARSHRCPPPSLSGDHERPCIRPRSRGWRLRNNGQDRRGTRGACRCRNANPSGNHRKGFKRSGRKLVASLSTERQICNLHML